jgi:hypothetical protein
VGIPELDVCRRQLARRIVEAQDSSRDRIARHGPEDLTTLHFLGRWVGLVEAYAVIAGFPLPQENAHEWPEILEVQADAERWAGLT